jgi:hypothetical protein
MKKKCFSYRFVRSLVELFYKKRELIGLENISKEEAMIIVGNHAQIHSPILSEVQFPLKCKTWCIGNVLTKKEFIEHAKTDFFGMKPKYTQWFYTMLAHILAPIAVNGFNDSDIIPVYKDMRLIKTFRLTVDNLCEGNHIFIYPECHTPYNNIVNEFQDKFVDVAKLYYKKTGKCVKFVPMYNAARLKKVVFGKPIEFDPNRSIDEMRKIIVEYLKQEITSLAQTLPPHKVVQFSNTGSKNSPMSK